MQHDPAVFEFTCILVHKGKTRGRGGHALLVEEGVDLAILAAGRAFRLFGPLDVSLPETAEWFAAVHDAVITRVVDYQQYLELVARALPCCPGVMN